MKNKLIRITTVAAIASMIMNTFPFIVYAQVSDDAVAKEESQVSENNINDDPEDIAVPEGPLTPDGNLTIIDDYGSPDKTGKQFITVSSKNGNIFYIIIDRDDKGENTVHFLNLVDERDIMSLMDEEEIESIYGTSSEEVIEEPIIEEPVEEEPEVIEEEPVKTKSKVGALATLAILAACGAVAYVFLSGKSGNKKKNDYPDPDADYDEDDYLDDLPTESEAIPDDMDFDTEELEEEL